jgi:capsular polysaccharide biosynthesis protein
MDVNDVFVRVFRGHWRLFLVCLLVPLLVAGALILRPSRTYESSARVQGGTVLPGTDTEADALLNLVDGVATSRAVVTGALHDTHLHRDPTATATNVTVTRLGSSTVFDVTVKDAQAAAAIGLAQALAGRLVAYLNGVGSARTTNLLDGLAKREQDLTAQRQKTAAALALATDAVSRANLAAQLAGIDQELNDLDGTARQVELGATPGGSSGAASIISPATSARPAPRHVAADLGLTAVVGLVLGLLLVTALETLRPRVAGARALARDLNAPVVGVLELAGRRRSRRAHRRTRAAPEEVVLRIEPELLAAVTGAAARLGVDLVLLIGPVPAPCLGQAAAALRNSLCQRSDRATLNGKVPEETVIGQPGSLSQSPEDSGAGGVAVAHPMVLVAERPAMLQPGAVAERRPSPIDVRPFDATDVGVGTANRGLLVLVPPLARLRDARRVGDLAAATGWPLLGVVELRWRSRRRSRRAQERS